MIAAKAIKVLNILKMCHIWLYKLKGQEQKQLRRQRQNTTLHNNTQKENTKLTITVSYLKVLQK